MAWTAEMDATLRERAALKMPYREIGKLLGLSKNAVVGRAGRIGLSVPAGPRGTKRLTPEEYNARKRARMAKHNRLRMIRRRAGVLPAVVRVIGTRPERVPVFKQPKLLLADVIPLHVSLLDLQHGQCRYPYGDGPFTFCGCPAIAKLSYCEPHQRLTRREVQA